MFYALKFITFSLVRYAVLLSSKTTNMKFTVVFDDPAYHLPKEIKTAIEELCPKSL